MLIFRSSALKHNISEDQVREVLANKFGGTKFLDFPDDDNGNTQEMAVGFDAEGRLIEIGITYLDEDDVVFHADNATPNWQKRYNQE